MDASLQRRRDEKSCGAESTPVSSSERPPQRGMCHLKLLGLAALSLGLCFAFLWSFQFDPLQDHDQELALQRSESLAGREHLVGEILPTDEPHPLPPQEKSQKGRNVIENLTPQEKSRRRKLIKNLTSQEKSLTLREHWAGVPIVIKKYKFLFFPVSKVAVANWKQLLRRMSGQPDWTKENVLNPALMGVTNFDELPLEEAKEILTSDDWTRAVFLREPSERLFSAYADKVYRNKEGERKPGSAKFKQLTYLPFDQFLDRCITDDGSVHSRFCNSDQHFIPQATVLPDMKKWGFVINFWGRFEHMADDAKAMMERLGPGVWEEFGASGWGAFGNNSLFAEQQSPNHVSSSKVIAAEYQHLLPRIRQHLALDYEVFGDKYEWDTAETNSP